MTEHQRDAIVDPAWLSDLVPVAWVLVDARGRVRQANEAARELLATDPSVTVERLQRCGGGECQTARHGTLRVTVTALAPDPRDQFGSLDGAVVIQLTGPAVTSWTRREAARTRFGATPAECAVADQVAAGASVAAIAATLGVSRETVRTHLKRLFAKTGTHSQRALAEMIRGAVLDSPGA